MLLLNLMQLVLLTPLYYLNRNKTNITHTPGDRMVSADEHLCVGCNFEKEGSGTCK